MCLTKNICFSLVTLLELKLRCISLRNLTFPIELFVSIKNLNRGTPFSFWLPPFWADNGTILVDIRTVARVGGGGRWCRGCEQPPKVRILVLKVIYSAGPPDKVKYTYIEDISSNVRGALGSIFTGCMPLASQSPYPIIVYSVANYRPHLSHFLP